MTPSTGIKRQYAQALAEAQEFARMFDGCVLRWEFAGSLRRKKAEVGDIEHVIIPNGGKLWAQLEELTFNEDSMFSDPALPLRKAVYSNGTNRWGEKYRGVEYKGFKHEMFIATPENWGSIFAIRTGPAEFSQRMVTQMHRYGLRQQGGVVVREDGSIFPTPTEQDFFRAAGEPWCEPEARQ